MTSKKIRRLKVGIADVRVDKNWGNSTLTIRQYGDSPREVIIQISDPNDLCYLRGKLSEIESYWRESLK